MTTEDVPVRARRAGARPARKPKDPAGTASAGLVLAALGVVFGDIGTSPLYALQTVFSIDNGAVHPSASNIYGVISLIVWSVTLIVSIKYVSIVMRADNDGEGGVMALTALARRLYANAPARTVAILTVGIVGVSLFYGDAIITPAISVLSAVEGLRVATPSLGHLVLPLAAVILAGVFAVQRFGTGRVGRLFGPIMVVYFAVLAIGGLHEVAKHPQVLKGLSPSYAVAFVIDHPHVAFLAMGAAVLVITGAEALYADMGHFGRPPIRRAWFFIVFPALALNYLGQAALVISRPSTASSPFFLLFPTWSRIPMVVLATMATVIASQAVISGAFSLSRQAMQLGLLPPLTVRQTSTTAAGQIFLPAVNKLLFVGVLTVMLSFRSSQRLATAYGVSVTGALVVDTVLLLLVARVLWRWNGPRLVAAGVVFGGLELAFLAGNLSKIVHGGWLPLVIAATLLVLMTTWRRGREVVAGNRQRQEGSLRDFIEQARHDDVIRVAGTAVFPHPGKDTTPLALRANYEHNHVLHMGVLIVSAEAANVPHVPLQESIRSDELGYGDDGIQHLSVRYGFADLPDLPAALAEAARAGVLEPGVVDVEYASYFISRGAVRRTHTPGLAQWRKALFVVLSHNTADPTVYFGLPPERTIRVGSDVDI